MDHLADAPIANILIIAGVIFLAVGLFGRVGGFIGSIFGNIEAGNSSRVLAGVLGGFLIIGGGWLHQLGDKAAAKNPTVAAPAVTPTAIVPNPSNASVAPVPVPAATTPTSPAPRVAPASANSRTTQPTMAAKREDLPRAPSAPAAPAFDDRLIGTWTNVIPPQKTGTVARIQIERAASGLDGHIWAKCNTGECDFGVHHMTISGNTCTFDLVSGNRRIVGSMHVYAPNILLLSGDSYEPGTSNHWHHNRVFANSNLSGKLQVAFSVYLDAPGQKAFAMTPAGAWASYRKQSTTEEAKQGALQYCQDHGWHDCRIILLNDEGLEQQ
jgi:hypothetical protein